MALDVDSLEPKVRSILTAPGVDLATISAKRVRKQLMELDSTLTAEYVREYKEEINGVISQVFEEVSGAQEESEGEGESVQSNKRKKTGNDSEGDDGEDPEADVVPPKKKKAKKNVQEKSDEKLARKLSSEINGRPHRAGTGKSRSNGTAKKGGRSKKSASTVDSDGEEDGGGKKKRGGGGGKGGFGKEYNLSEPLSAVLRVEKLSRPQVVKQLWDYIKENELQNPSNKREIICDSGLRAVFNVDKIDMFRMNKVLGQHLHEAALS